MSFQQEFKELLEESVALSTFILFLFISHDTG